MTTVKELRDRVAEGYEEYLKRTWRRNYQPIARASGIGNRCLTRQVLDIKLPNDAREPDLETRGIFWTGVTAHWLKTMALTVSAGRDMTEREAAESSAVARLKKSRDNVLNLRSTSSRRSLITRSLTQPRQ